MEKESGQSNIPDEKGRRYSLQREIIYETLKNSNTHPDVDAIFAEVRKRLPDIGIATVYRNLRQLVAAGLVETLETTKDCIHYDADLSSHAHFVCERCGRITDLVAVPMAEAVEKLGYTVTREKLVFYGICADCKREEDKTE